jgi:hypothetical protein
MPYERSAVTKRDWNRVGTSKGIWAIACVNKFKIT